MLRGKRWEAIISVAAASMKFWFTETEYVEPWSLSEKPIDLSCQAQRKAWSMSTVDNAKPKVIYYRLTDLDSPIYATERLVLQFCDNQLVARQLILSQN